MKQIIDTNYLQTQELEDYLKRSSNNFAVVTEYLAMEIYKGDALKSTFSSLRILSKYPQQVIILKGTRDIAKLKPSSKNLQRRMENQIETSNFKKFCDDLRKAENGDSGLRASIVEYGKSASKRMDELLIEADGVAAGIMEVSKSLDKTYLHLLKKREEIPQQYLEGMLANVFNITGFFYRNHPDVKYIPRDKSIVSSYLFRYALCGYLLALRWISDGGTIGVKTEKIRNDMIDVNFITYATFFDGFLSKDKKSREIYYEALYFLNNVFV